MTPAIVEVAKNLKNVVASELFYLEGSLSVLIFVDPARGVNISGLKID